MVICLDEGASAIQKKTTSVKPLACSLSQKNLKVWVPDRSLFFTIKFIRNGIEWIAYNEKFITYSKLDLPNKFHPNQTKIAKVFYWGGFWMGGLLGWAKRTPSHAIY